MLHTVTSAALRALPQEALQDMDKALQVPWALGVYGFNSRNVTLPKVRLQTQQEQQLKGKTIVVALDAWDATSRYPTAHYVRTLGETGDKNVESEALCIDHEVDTRAFSQKVINCLPPKTWVVRAPQLYAVLLRRNASSGARERLRPRQRPRRLPLSQRHVCPPPPLPALQN